MKYFSIKTLLVTTAFSALTLQAQTTGFSFRSTDGAYWKIQKVTCSDKIYGTPMIVIRSTEPQQTFKGWGTCFNELPWDAYNLMSSTDKTLFAKRMFSPKGDLRINVGRISVGANDYARSWYSCDEMDGDNTDFNMDHFNIDRDLTTIIPSIKVAQAENPDMVFWASPWSPPQWMKTNKHYAQRKTSTNGCPTDVPPYFNDQFIPEDKYYNAYCLYFDKFIQAYAGQGIPIKALAYQNEAYSYTPYPGCSWKAVTTGKFLANYLGPYFAQHQPDVTLILGTMNTASTDVYEQILNTPDIDKYVKQIGYQWEGGRAMPEIMRRHPGYESVMTESECGSGTFDWGAAAHTFQLINHYLANRCTYYTYWNAILKDKGISTWGWQQNALVQVNSATNKPYYTAEYYAFKHYSHLIPAGSKILVVDEHNLTLSALTPDGAVVVVAGNDAAAAKTVTMDIDGKYFQAELPAKSFTSYVFGSDKAQLTVLLSEAEGLVDIESASLSEAQTAALNAAITQGKSATDTNQSEAIEALETALVNVEKGGATVTGEIVNPSFTSGSTGWTTNNISNGGDFRTNTIANKSCWNNWSNNFTSMDIYQTVSGLKPGIYTASCVSMCGSGEISDQHAYLIAQTDTAVSGIKKVAIWNTAAGWEQQTTSSIVVGTDGTLRVGYASTSGGGTKGWFCVTDFALQHLADDTSTIATALTNCITKAEALLSTNKSNTVLAQAIAAAKTAEGFDAQIAALTQLRQAVQSVATLSASLEAYNAKVKEAETITSDTLYATTAREALTSLLTTQNGELAAVTSTAEIADLMRQIDSEIAKAKLTQQPSDTTDFTFYIQNPGADDTYIDGIPQGWTLSNTNGDATTKAGQSYTGVATNRYFDSYNGTAGNLWYTGRQTLTNIPNGTYRLTCVARADGEGAYLTAETTSESWKTEVSNSGNTGGKIWQTSTDGSAPKQANGGKGFGWASYAIDSIKVTDHTLTIGFTNDMYLTGKKWTGTWFSFDEFALFYTAADTHTSISSTVSDGLHVSGGKGTLVITSHEPYRVYNLNGISVNPNGTLQQGIYIVKTATVAKKAIVR